MSHFYSVRTQAAFFDLDNTLIDGSSVYYFIKGMIKHGEITKRNLARIAYDQYRFQRKKTESENAISHATKKLLEFAKDKPQKHLVELCQKIVDDFLPRVLIPTMRSKIEEHKALGHDTWIITASPIEIARIVASELKMTGAFGSAGEVIKGKYSGNLPEGAMHGMRKAETIHELAQVKGYDLSSSFAYSDSVNDLPLLVSVGNPHIVNPNKELTIIANKNKWPILVK